MNNLLREIIDFIRFIWKTPYENKSIVFYSEHEGYYPVFEGLISELTDSHERTICYITSDPNDPIFSSSSEKIITFYINKLLIVFMQIVNCKVFIMTLADLNQLHLKRSVNPVHYMYVFHSLLSTAMQYRFGAFDYYDTIFCGNSHQVREIRKHEKMYELRKKILIEAGYYRLERIHKTFKEYSSVQSSSNMKGTVLIAPSWGKDNILESCGEVLVGLLLKAGFEVIVRPHPETVRRSPKLLDSFSNQFGANPNFTSDASVATDESILRADVLICDYSGIALEYALGTERPVLFLDVPVKIKNSRYKELNIEPLELTLRSEIGVIISPEQLIKVPQIITSLILKKNKYAQKLSKLRDDNVFVFGKSSEVGAHYIIDFIDK